MESGAVSPGGVVKKRCRANMRVAQKSYGLIDMIRRKCYDYPDIELICGIMSFDPLLYLAGGDSSGGKAWKKK